MLHTCFDVLNAAAKLGRVFHFIAANSSDVSSSFLSSQSHKPFESESSKIFSSQSHDLIESSHKNCRVASSHWFASSSQCRLTQNFTFFLRHLLQWNGIQDAI